MFVLNKPFVICVLNIQKNHHSFASILELVCNVSQLFEMDDISRHFKMHMQLSNGTKGLIFSPSLFLTSICCVCKQGWL